MTERLDDPQRADKERDLRQSPKQKEALRLAHQCGHGLGFTDATKLAEAFCELWDELDIAYACAASSEAPCGHDERYCYTEDGGKNIVCLLCERAERPTARSAGTRTADEPVWLWGLLQENPRAEVIQFAVAMERKLRANDHKGHWGDCSRNYLLRRLRQEANELGRAVYGEKVNQQTVCDEAADVANFAMMIADVCAALPQMPALPTGTPRSASTPLTKRERGRMDRLKDRCHVLQARLDDGTAGKQDWEQELSALSWAVAWIEEKVTNNATDSRANHGKA